MKQLAGNVEPELIVTSATRCHLGPTMAHKCSRQPLAFVTSGVAQASLMLKPVPQFFEHHRLQGAAHAAQVLIDQDQIVAGHKGPMDAGGLEISAVQLRR